MAEKHNQDSSEQPNKNPEALEKFVEYQGKEIELRKQELEQRKQESWQDFEYAKLALEAQERTLVSDKSHTENLISTILKYGVGIILIAILFLGWLAYIGQAGLVEEILKAFLYIAVAGFGGYKWGQSDADESNTAN